MVFCKRIRLNTTILVLNCRLPNLLEINTMRFLSLAFPLFFLLGHSGTSFADDKNAPAVDPFDQSKVPLEVDPPADFTGKKIVLVAGRQSHGPGEHEFFAGTAIMMNLLKQ